MASKNLPQPARPSPEGLSPEDLLSPEMVFRTPVSQTAPVEGLVKPVVIPRISTSSFLFAKLPFMRAYSPALVQQGIREAEFLAFIDNLVVCQAPPVPLQALDKAGTVVGAVPHHWAMATGTGMSVAAGVGTAATTIVRTKQFMEKVNREMFGPRGLEATICKSDELIRRLGCGVIDIGSTPAESPESEVHISSFTERRMQALAPYIAPLTFDVPPPSPQRRFIDQGSARAIEHRVAKRESKEKRKAEKSMRKEGRAAQHSTQAGYISDTSSTSSDPSSMSDDEHAHRGSEDMSKQEKKMRKINCKAERELEKAEAKDTAKIERKRAEKIGKIERESERRVQKDSKKAADRLQKASKKQDKRSEKQRRKEEEKIATMEFLVIDNLKSS